jgi:hypothetical protein
LEATQERKGEPPHLSPSPWPDFSACPWAESRDRRGRFHELQRRFNAPRDASSTPPY